MASDVMVYVVDPQTMTVVYRRWIGMGGVRDRVFEVLGRKPDEARVGVNCWGRVSLSELQEIVKASYVDGLTEQELERYAELFPEARFWWSLFHDY